MFFKKKAKKIDKRFSRVWDQIDYSILERDKLEHRVNQLEVKINKHIREE